MKTFSHITGVDWLQGRQLVPILREHGSRAKGSVLDLGCGRSPFRSLFQNAAKYIRLDRYQVDEEVITISDPSKLPLESESIEIVILSRVIGDIPDVTAVLSELFRVLEVGGRVLVYESISYPQHDLPHDYWRVLPGGLKWAAGNAGLVADEPQYLGGYFTQIAMHWNQYIVGSLGGSAVTRPLVSLARAAGNMICLGLDRLISRPTLSSDYFCCLRKTKSGPHGTGHI